MDKINFDKVNLGNPRNISQNEIMADNKLMTGIAVAQLASSLVQHIMGGTQSQPEFKTILDDQRKQQERQNEMLRRQIFEVEKQVKDENEYEREILNQKEQQMNEELDRQRQEINKELERRDNEQVEQRQIMERKLELEKERLSEEKKLLERKVESEAEKLKMRKAEHEKLYIEKQNELEERYKIESEKLSENGLELENEIQRTNLYLKEQEEKLKEENLKKEMHLKKRFENEFIILAEEAKLYKMEYDNKLKQLDDRRIQMDEKYKEDTANMIEWQSKNEKRNELARQTIFDVLKSNEKRRCITNNPHTTYNITYHINTQGSKGELPLTSTSIPKEIVYNQNGGAIQEEVALDWKSGSKGKLPPSTSTSIPNQIVYNRNNEAIQEEIALGWKSALNSLPVPIGDENLRELGEKVSKLTKNEKEELDRSINELLEKCGITANDPGAKDIAIRLTQTFLKNL